MLGDSGKNIDKRDLGFVESVAEYITPVLLPHEFVCVSSTDVSVVFESAAVRLSVSHDLRSYEIELYLRLKSREKCEISLNGIVDSAVGPLPKPGIHFASIDRRVVAPSLQKMAALLARFGQNVLRGDAAEFEKIASLSRAKFLAEFQISPARERARAAWERRDFALVQKLYESIESELTPLEKKQLDFAKRHL